MAGHSKWANVKHRKARVDAQKGKIFTKLAREIIVAAREGGGDINANFRLRLAVQKARENNMPGDNIQRAIQKGAGGSEGEVYEQISYEGYAPGGVAVLLDVMTDNRNRTVADIRHIFSRHGGSLGESGCVAWMFARKGLIILRKEELRIDEDEMMLLALEAGAADIKDEGDAFSIITELEDFETVKEHLLAHKVRPAGAEVTKLPSSTVPVANPDDVKRILGLMEGLEDHDDVQSVYANFDIPDELMLQP
jgi:YebC/PmpR family DNA-binding regulatory protein